MMLWFAAALVMPTPFDYGLLKGLRRHQSLEFKLYRSIPSGTSALWEKSGS
jgi:hypothetical protein